MAKKDKKAEAKVTKLEVNPKEESATPETNEVPVADPLKEIVGYNTSVTEPFPVWTNGEIKDSASELKDPEFHESEPEVKPSEITDAPSKPRYHRQDVVNIAKICHEANKAWCEANNDHSQKSWDDAEDWQRESAIKGVDFKLSNPEAGDDAQHNAWMQDKIDQGWTYGEIKNLEAKTHPCIVPFNELPKFQQKKDALFAAIVNALK